MKLAKGRLLLIVAFSLLAFSASATTYVVNPDGTGIYSTIQAAVNVCQDGDVVELLDGTYTPDVMGNNNNGIIFGGRSITLCSQSGNASACILDMQGSENGINQRAMYFSGGETRNTIIKDLTISNGYADAC